MKHAFTIVLLLASGIVFSQKKQSETADKKDLDRATILKMEGCYKVTFSFAETFSPNPDYRYDNDRKHESAIELVKVIENTPDRISLQHLLVANDTMVIKHWRQEWIFEAPRRWEFSADQTWRWRDLPTEQIKGHWTQCVYEVSDAPRYCGTGRWVHEGGISTWTSDTSWRPLPRRDYTKRSDYNALGAINRHTITPEGWTHEQDNTKAIRDGAGEILGLVVREFGFNDYRRTGEIDFSPVYQYWSASAGYWARIRARWESCLQEASGIRLSTERDGMALIEPMFQHAQTVIEGGAVEEEELDALFAQWVQSIDEHG